MQACKALKEEGYTVILVNSNPAKMPRAVAFVAPPAPTVSEAAKALSPTAFIAGTP